ncbi:hypothetical protein E1A91_D03G091200v1 [Gossypium mustelinum]|uniref:Chromatin modification-related protein MEAF6 n=1 Tax=Gossypium mustelinum TaxID=34275 RepID=A0A5D2VKW0_GOSMU|nr:hypothetical protein E1A91_D03G091200v1 [Gossypium mustelinum]
MKISLRHKNLGNPIAILSSLMNKREKLQDELCNIEKQVFELETNYLQDSSHFKHVLKGSEGFLSSSNNTTNNFIYEFILNHLKAKKKPQEYGVGSSLQLALKLGYEEE